MDFFLVRRRPCDGCTLIHKLLDIGWVQTGKWARFCSSQKAAVLGETLLCSGTKYDKKTRSIYVNHGRTLGRGVFRRSCGWALLRNPTVESREPTPKR
jgi:hypothetical protein